MAIQVEANELYTGLSIHKQINRNIERSLEGYKSQIRSGDMFKADTVLKMLNDLEKLLRVELE